VRLRVHHETVYEYPEPVELGPQLLRLSPRDDPTQRVIVGALRVDPVPARRTSYCDAAGNAVTRCWFADTTSRFAITSAFEVETLRPDPFDFAPDPSFNSVPAFYPDDLRALLAPYRERRATGDDPVWRFAREVIADSDATPMGFALALTRAMSLSFRPCIGDGGHAKTPAQTLAARAGACRDLAVLFLDAARALGLAARFVSGYRRGDLRPSEGHLHAWAEVYVEGGGWRGFDPVEGLAVRDDHVALAAAPTQVATMPVEGSFRGAGGASTLACTVHIEAG
jgi:transglutaminase-like putative cysteine protease